MPGLCLVPHLPHPHIQSSSFVGRLLIGEKVGDLLEENKRRSPEVDTSGDQEIRDPGMQLNEKKKKTQETNKKNPCRACTI